MTDQELMQKNPQLWAVRHMLKNVYVPALLNKLASYGIVPKTQEDVKTLVKIAAMLSEVDHANTVVNATVGDETSKFIKESADELSASLCGVTDTQQQQEQIKLAATYNQVKNDPVTRTAAMLYAAVANS